MARHRDQVHRLEHRSAPTTQVSSAPGQCDPCCMLGSEEPTHDPTLDPHRIAILDGKLDLDAGPGARERPEQVGQVGRSGRKYSAVVTAAIRSRPRRRPRRSAAVIERLGQAPQQLRAVTNRDIIDLLHNLESDGLDFIKTENLCTLDGEAGYALGQGQ